MSGQAPNSPEKPSCHDCANATPVRFGLHDGLSKPAQCDRMLRQLGRVPTGGWMLSFAAFFAFAALIWTDATGDWSFSNWWVEAGPVATAFFTALAARLGHRSLRALVGWTLFAPFVWALLLAPALVVLALVVGLVYGHGIK
jgi:hypothetical protein